MKIYEAGMKRGRLESRLGVIAEKNEQSVLQGVPALPEHLSGVVFSDADLRTSPALPPSLLAV